MNARTDQAGTTADAAADWLVARDRGLSEREQRDFDVWLASSEENREEWRQAETLWGSFDSEPDALLSSLRVEALSARPPRFRVLPVWAAAAAAVALTVGMGTWTHFGAKRSAGPEMAAARVLTGGASRSEVALEDGSRVLLDAGARISVLETAGRRDVALQAGRAFFKVAHDPSRPFVVASGDRTVTATGTAFAVARGNAGLSVTLAEGRVRIDVSGRPDDRVDLVAGQEYRAAAGQHSVVASVDLDDALSWRDGFLSLHNATVREALAMMDHSRPPRVVVGDPAAGQLRVSGRFPINDPAAFVNTLSVMYPVRVKRLPSGQLRISTISPGTVRRREGR